MGWTEAELGGSAWSPPDQSPLYPQTWTNVAACPRPVLPGAAKTLQAASVACAAPASEPARGLRSVWVRNPPHPTPGLTPARPCCPGRAPAVVGEQFPSSNASPSPLGPTIAALVPDPAPRLAPAFPSTPLLPLPGPAGPSRGGQCLPYYCGTFLSDRIPRRPSLGPALSIFQTLDLAPSKCRTSSLPPPGPASVLQLPKLVS